METKKETWEEKTRREAAEERELLHQADVARESRHLHLSRRSANFSRWMNGDDRD